MPRPPRRVPSRPPLRRLAGLACALLAASPALAQSSGALPGEAMMEVAFGPELTARSADGAARLSVVCAVTDHPTRSNPRAQLREPWLLAEIDADADAFVFYETRETRRLKVDFEADDAPMRWSPQKLERVARPRGSARSISASMVGTVMKWVMRSR